MSSIDRPLRRHDLVWLDADCWRTALRAPLPDASREPLRAWFAAGYPAVVRRQEAVPPDVIGVGVALSPRHGKTKVSLLIARRAITRASGPLPLAAVITSAPARWRPWLARLAADARAIGVEFQVYGSLAWQHVSGAPYVTAASDVDLLWQASDRGIIDRTLALLVHWQRASGLRADGELLLAPDMAVAWKELLQRPRHLLVKRTGSVELQSCAAVLAGAGRAAC